MGSQSELFSRAAACDRLMKMTVDPMRREILNQLREVWIALASQSDSIGPPTVASEMISNVEQIEARFEKSEEIRAASRRPHRERVAKHTGKIWRRSAWPE